MREVDIDGFIDSLPCPELVHHFFRRLEQAAPSTFSICSRDPRQMANLAVVASYSPFLSDTLLQRPESVEWLGNQRDLDRIKSKEQLSEELARFAAMNASLSESVMLHRFKRREVLRIYLRDCLGLATLTQTTLELSILADVILARAVWRAKQVLVDQIGVPQILDSRKKSRESGFAIVALGKLGSRELNYASDIDLIYLFEGPGCTTREGLSNHEFFTRLAEHVTRTIGGLADEGATYRIDLRLRPHGTQGALTISVPEAVKYYRYQAANWECQSLLRARAAAGDPGLVDRLLRSIRARLYPREPLPQVLKEVRESKLRIERRSNRGPGAPDIKLDRGGIRDIEFIVHALQIYRGGSDRWIRVPQILIGLQRLADRGWIDDRDRAALARAYSFFRTLEHRLQMEFGQRTHSLPDDPTRVAALARRMGYAKDSGAEGGSRLGGVSCRSTSEAFLTDLQAHRSHVAEIFDRVFSGVDTDSPATIGPRLRAPEGPPALSKLARSFAVMAGVSRVSDTLSDLTLEEWSSRASKVDRAIGNITAFLDSLRRLNRGNVAQSKIDSPEAGPSHSPISIGTLRRVFEVLANSQYFAPILISHPELASSVEPPLHALERAWDPTPAFRESLQSVEEGSLAETMNRFRRRWYRELLWIGSADLERAIDLGDSNRLQTSLARICLETAVLLAQRTLEREMRGQALLPRFAFLALGRLAHHGMDYGSDLDLLCVYDPESAEKEKDGEMLLTRLMEIVIQVLSAVTREGFLYRVDLRLRPEGTVGSLARSGAGFLTYAGAAPAWERMAYLKLRSVAGDVAFGRRICQACQSAILDHPANRTHNLYKEVLAVRARLENEKAGRDRHRHVKHGVGGMMDVYFITRYLQLREGIQEPEAPGTITLIDELVKARAIDPDHHRVLRDGYLFLRRVDHALRLIFDARKAILPANSKRLSELSRWLELGSGSELEEAYRHHTRAIRTVFEQVTR